MAKTVETWLAEQFREELDEVGHAGLYQFFWLLNGSAYEVGTAEAREIAKRIAKRLLADQVAKLYRMHWPQWEPIEGPLPDAMIDLDESWQDSPDDMEYLALVKTDRPA